MATIRCDRCGSPSPARLASELRKVKSYNAEQKTFRCRACQTVFWNRRAPSATDTAFRAALIEAVDRSGTSVAEACRQAGLDRATVRKWTDGKSTPRRYNIERLAEVLDAPELLTAIDVSPSPPFRAGGASSIRMACDSCGLAKDYAPAALRSVLNRGGFAGAQVDFDLGVGSYPRCRKCSLAANAEHNFIEPRVRGKRHKRFWSERGKRAGSLAVASGTWERAIAASPANKRGYKQSQEHIDATILGKLAPRLSGDFTVCRLCPFLLYTKKKGRVSEVHLRCLNRFRRDQAAAGVSNLTYPPKRGGRPASADGLMDGYEMAVRHLAHGESYGQLVDRFDIGGDNGERMVRKAIERFLERLPRDDRAGRYFQRRAAVLLRRAQARGWRVARDF